VIHARLDRKTRRRVLCGNRKGTHPSTRPGELCPGELGVVTEVSSGYLVIRRRDGTSRQSPLFPTSRSPRYRVMAFPDGSVGSRWVERCPECGAKVLTDLVALWFEIRDDLATNTVET
jgi:hypothetical protein